MRGLLFFLTLFVALAASPVDPTRAQDNESAGTYTLGLYADAAGTQRVGQFGREATTAEIHLGMTGDPGRHFSGAVFRLELPRGIRVDGPIEWSGALGPLRESERILGRGGQVVFPDCALQPDDGPLMIASLRIAFDADVDRIELAPSGHADYGVGVQLCRVGEEWPKREAEALGLVLERRRTFWDRIRALFE